MLKIVYRISDVGYSKVKPSYINNENCLRNATQAFSPDTYQWHVVADSVSEGTKAMIEKYVDPSCITHVNIKNGPGFPFLHMLDKILAESEDTDVVYFLENDYIHKKGADAVLLEGVGLGADYITLYDHPDKYKDPSEGGNFHCEGGGEVTRVFLTETCHWKFTNSTTGTFAASVKTLKEDYNTIKKYANNPNWSDYHMFMELRELNKSLISCIPGYSTHGETAWLAPLTDWSKQ
jgi:hypothetical protein